MCKITDEIVRRAKRCLRNNSIDKIEKNFLERMDVAKKTSDPVARDFAIKNAQHLKSQARSSYFLAQEIMKEWAKANNGKSRKKKVASLSPSSV
jgi:hypothetical protein